MHIAVIGAGVAGVATAWELAAAGAEVEVFERRGSVAEQASHANPVMFATGWLPPGRRTPLPGELPVPLPTGWALQPSLWTWLRAARRARRDGRLGVREAALRSLLALSRERLTELERQYDAGAETTAGLLVLLRGEPELKAARPGLKRLAEAGAPYELLDAQRVRDWEPALAEQLVLRAAIRLPADGAGNCRLWAQQLRAQAQRLGARFHFGTAVSQVVPGARPQVRWQPATESAAVSSAEPARPGEDDLPDRGTQDFDAVVLCSGSHGLAMVPGLSLPLAAVSGHAVTAPLREHDGGATAGPRSAIVDARSGITVARIGERVRVAGPGRLGPAPTRKRADGDDLGPLYRALDDWFPGAALARQAQPWCGTRTLLPDGLPVLGASGHDGIWINAGHGACGWALASGAAQALVAVITGRPPPVDLATMAPARWR